MERDGISKCCTMKVRMNSPTTSTEAIPAIDSGKVSLGRSGLSFLSEFLFNKGKMYVLELKSVHQVEHPAPARFIKKMHDHVEEKAYSFSGLFAFVLVAGGIERPVDEQRTAHDVFPGYKSPVAAVQANVTVVAHAEEAVRRHQQFAIAQVGPHLHRPFGVCAVVLAVGKILAEFIP